MKNMLVFSIFLLSCSRPISSVSVTSIDITDASEEELTTSQITTKANQYLHVIQDEVTINTTFLDFPISVEERYVSSNYLLGSSFFPTSIFPSFDFSSLLPGDTFIGEYYDEIEEYGWAPLVYPGDFLHGKEITVLSTKVEHASIIEIAIHDGVIDPIDNIDFTNLFLKYAIGEDARIVELSSITKGYATISASHPNLARAIYTYNPRP